jgi:cytochrome c
MAVPGAVAALVAPAATASGLEAGVPHKVGPNLHDVVGRRAGTSEGFRYSEALAQSGIVWAMVRGNGMAFAGRRRTC